MTSYISWSLRPLERIFFSRNILFVFASASTFALSFPGPFEVSALAWVAFIPLLFALRSIKTIPEAITSGLIFGILFYGLGGAWFLTTNSYQRIGWTILLVLWTVCHFIPFFIVALWLKRISPPSRFPLHLIVLWIALDWVVRETLFRNPYFNIAESQYDVPVLVQITDMGGIYFLAFLILLVNTALFFFLSHHGDWLRMHRIEKCTLGVAVVLLLATAGYGFKKTPETKTFKDPAKTFSFIAIQPNFRYGDERALDNTYRLETLIGLSEEALAEKGQKPDLILWPETVIPMLILGETDDLKTLRVIDKEKTEMIIRFYEETGKIPLVFGTYLASRAYPARPVLFYNSAVFLSGDMFRWYNKTKPLFLAESAPESLIKILRTYSSRFSAELSQKLRGKELASFSAHGLGLGTYICSESGIASVARTQTARGAHLLINPTDDSSMDSAWEIRQHAANNRFRAVENRRWVISVGTVGPTQLISPQGEVVRSLPVFTRSWLSETVSIDVNQENTFYTRWGHRFPLLLLLFFFLALGYEARQKHHPVGVDSSL